LEPVDRGIGMSQFCLADREAVKFWVTAHPYSTFSKLWAGQRLVTWGFGLESLD